MSDRVTLVGLDFGTTTSCAAIASAELACGSPTGRRQLSSIKPLYESEPVFTPFVGDTVDEDRLGEYLATWLGEVDPRQVFGGGALVTGLAAQRSNAPLFARQTRRYLQDAIVAVANDPCLESWLAFMGNCAELSRANPERAIINLDIGGGTTNIALGKDGEVQRTGSYYVAARHVIVEPGSYRITALSNQATRLLSHLQISKGIGDELAEHEVRAVVAWYLDLLQSVITNASHLASDPVTRLHQQTAFTLPADFSGAAVTLSGGVGQLVYKHTQGAAWPSTTAFGDLGIDMAKGIVANTLWRDLLRDFAPLALGRATVYGLLRYSTQASGSTLYLCEPAMLPLDDLLIVGSLGPESSSDEIERLLTLAGRSSAGACLRIDWPGDFPPVRELATRLGTALINHVAFQNIPLVFLMQQNLGKVFGQYLTGWEKSKFKAVVIDEVEHRDMQFAQIGRHRDGVVPVSFFGMKRLGTAP